LESILKIEIKSINFAKTKIYLSLLNNLLCIMRKLKWRTKNKKINKLEKKKNLSYSHFSWRLMKRGQKPKVKAARGSEKESVCVSEVLVAFFDSALSG